MPRAKKMQVAGEQYGEQAALSRAQDAVPAGPAVTNPPPTPFISPEEVPNLNAPSARPDEPVTAGMPFGPGSGPNPVGMPTESPLLRQLRAMYAQYPSIHLRRMIEKAGG